MIPLLFALGGFACGGLAMMAALDLRRKRLNKLGAEITAREGECERQLEDLRQQHSKFSEEMQRERDSASRQLKERLDKIRALESSSTDELRTRQLQFNQELRDREKHFTEEIRQQRESISKQLQDRVEKVTEELVARQTQFNQEVVDRNKQFTDEMQSKREQVQERIDKVQTYEAALKAQAAQLNDAQKEYDRRIVSYKELQAENGLVKRNMRNLAVAMQKLKLDQTLQHQAQAALDEKVAEIGDRYLKENIKWIGKSLNANNFANCKQKLLDVIERCRDIGFQITKQEEQAYIAELKSDYEKEVRAAFEREEQARIKAQIREEQKLEREIQRELDRIAREKAIVEAALAAALASAADEHSAEIESLRARLAEAEAKERAMSQAQLTKAGFVYVISNIGSFGDGVYKIGMTKGLEPLDRIRELGDASVPFPFDVHMMISCTNAPALEIAMHRALVQQQVNKTNPRKEFFRSDIDTILKLVKENHGEVEYVADPEALQYRQSLSMSDEDVEFIEHVFEEIDDDTEEVEDQTDPVKLPPEIQTSEV